MTDSTNSTNAAVADSSNVTINTIGCTCLRIKKLSRVVSRHYDQHLAVTGLKTTQYSLLKSIAYKALPIAELSAFLHTDRTTMTRNLKPLLDAGWVELRPGEDSRQRIVTITDSGRDKIRDAKQRWRLAQAQLEQALGVQLVQDLHSLIDTALSKLAALNEDN